MAKVEAEAEKANRSETEVDGLDGTTVECVRGNNRQLYMS